MPNNNDTNNNNHEEHYCMVCKRGEKETGRQLNLMGNMYICIDCLEKYSKQMSNQPINFMNIDKETLNSILGGSSIVNQPDDYKSVDSQQDVADETEYTKININDVLRPHEIKAILDKYIIGQDKAKKIISVATYNHFKRIFNEDDSVEIDKSNIIMVGPTGSGKTYLVKTLARILDVPLAITDATSLTETGYIGDDIESVLSKLLDNAGNDVKKAEHGIVFIDEIDKIAKKQEMRTRDVSGEAVQQGLLKLLEGNKIQVPVGAGNKNLFTPQKTIDTKNILFIVGGAFPGIENIVKERLKNCSSIGFNTQYVDDDSKSLLSNIAMEDLREYGMIPEILGRLPVLTTFDPLDIEALIKIVKEPQNAILKQYEKLFTIDGVKLIFEDEALRAVCEKAMKKNTGARALRAVIEDVLLDIMFEIPKDKNIKEVVITKDYVNNEGGPIIR